MANPPCLLTLAAALLLLPAAPASAAAAPALFDIVKILSCFPEFSDFTCMLVDTGVARSINAQKKVTVLAASNAGLPTAALRRLPHPLLGDLLSLHVVLDYLDPEKPDALRLGRTGKGSKVTTLLPGDELKLLRVAGGEEGRHTFSYAGPIGTGPQPLNATLLRVVTSQAFNVMVLQVSGLVLPGMMPATTASAFDVTKILSSFPEYSAFSSLLTQTGLARAINEHPIVTILAVNNTALSNELQGLPRLPLPALADLLALHAVLDFLDPAASGSSACPEATPAASRSPLARRAGARDATPRSSRSSPRRRSACWCSREEDEGRGGIVGRIK
uniref:Uncharacterized protein n=1 Tax=Aegilops tauschii TaxID=37682 RepID=M8C2J2_AEGTA